MTPLEGVRIVDFGDWIAGPFAARLMADLGASVIKIEPPGGLAIRPSGTSFNVHRTVNYIVRGMRDVVIDMKQAEGLEVAHRLIARADVITQNMRPGVADRLGIGYEAVRRLNPRAIYVFSPGFGAKGPRATQPSFEPLNSTFVGIHHRSGGEGNPPVIGISLDAYCGLIAACGTMMALLHRQRTGEGQYLDVSQLACAMYYTSETFRTMDGKVGPLPKLDGDQTGFGPLDRLYRTRDDWIAVCSEKEAEWHALCGVTGMKGLINDPRFRTAEARAANGEALATILAKWFEERTSSECAALLDGAGVPCEVPVKDGLSSLLRNEAYLESGLVNQHVHPLWGLVREIGSVIRLSETPGRAGWPAPALGAHTLEVLAEAGYSQADVSALLQRRAVYAALLRAGDAIA
jgi:crotonobetainyl-CoA:carnitine CoA-transferase CaiB-like acyl-CoA transferase